MSDFCRRSDCPFADAAEDMAEAMDAMGIARTSILARGGAHAALAFAHRHPARLGRVVLIGPDTEIGERSKRAGFLGVVKEIALRQPDRIAALARLTSVHVTPERLRRLLASALRSSPVDLDALSDAEAFEDYQRAVALFSTGRIEGIIREQIAYGAGIDAPALADATDWAVLIGALDLLHRAQDVGRYWRPRLPGARFDVIANGGRFLHLTHLERVCQTCR